jgi:hypothetical protein
LAEDVVAALLKSELGLTFVQCHTRSSGVVYATVARWRQSYRFFFLFTTDRFFFFLFTRDRFFFFHFTTPSPGPPSSPYVRVPLYYSTPIHTYNTTNNTNTNNNYGYGYAINTP